MEKRLAARVDRKPVCLVDVGAVSIGLCVRGGQALAPIRSPDFAAELRREICDCSQRRRRERRVCNFLAGRVPLGMTADLDQEGRGAFRIQNPEAQGPVASIGVDAKGNTCQVRLSGANAFEMSAIERMNIGRISRAFRR